MADWDKLNKELDSTLNSMSKEDWIEWKINMQNESIINWELHQKLMEKKNTITVCTGIGANMFFPEYVTIEFNPKESNTIVDDWLKEHGNPNISKKVGKYLEEMYIKRKEQKSKTNG